MKKLIKIILFILPFIFILLYLFRADPTNILRTNPKSTSSPDAQFINGALNSGWDINYQWVDTTLNFNLWHLYDGSDSDATGRRYPFGWLYWAPHDSLFTHIDYYRSDIQNALSEINYHHMKALMVRPKVEYLCYSQRSDYQCEFVSSENDLWFYSFNSDDPNHVHVGRTVQDNSNFGNGVWVKECLMSPRKKNVLEGYVVDRLKANAEQSNPGTSFQNGDSKREWIIKPRIRIDSSFANNPINRNTPVCKIILLGHEGNIFKEVILRARHFLVDSGNTYNGRYIEEYRFDFLLDTAHLRYFGAWSTIPQFYSSRGEGPENEAFNHSDIQVYWYGNCNMWIDYVRVEDDIADKLFKGYYEQPGREWLLWEARDIACYLQGNASYRFYIELFEFNNIPSMKYVSRKLDSLSFVNCGKHITLISMPIPMEYTWHLPWKDRLRIQNPIHVARNFIQDVGEQEFFLGFFPFNSSYHWPEPDPYPTWTLIPNTLPRHQGNGTLSRAVDPDVYDAWLQNYLDSIPYSFEEGYTGGIRSPVEEDPGGFRYAMQFGDSISKITGVPFLFNPQCHIWFCRCGAGGKQYFGKEMREITGEVQREPTNEELDMMINVAVSYGVRGIVWFEMLSSANIGDNFYSRGIMNPWSGYGMPGPPRDSNIYGQYKWGKIIDISRRIKIWESYIMNFNNTDRHSYIYRIETERNTCLNNTYFSDVISYRYNTSEINTNFENSNKPESDSIIIENLDQRYLQIATFDCIPVNSSQYFMIVNRRCSPKQTNNNGGERGVLIKLDANSVYFQAYSKWKIINIEDTLNYIKIDKSTSNLIDLGIFEPGEGRLYKVVQDIPTSVPRTYTLQQNFPNPFNSTTNIIYEIPIQSAVKINIYDILGRLVKTIKNESQPEGKYTVTLDLQNFASGVYFLKMESVSEKTQQQFKASKKMIFLK